MGDVCFMSTVFSFRCVICTLFYNDKIILANKTQACYHVYHDHDYIDKLKAGRFVQIIKNDEKRSAKWLTNHLAELSIVKDIQND